MNVNGFLGDRYSQRKWLLIIYVIKDADQKKNYEIYESVYCLFYCTKSDLSKVK